MTDTLLQTKLYIPATRPSLVPRPHLVEKLNAGLDSKLTLVSAPAEPFVLILDDFHLISERPIHDALTFLLGNLPPTMHLIISGRADPPWPLARLRARSEMTELRTNDLRFTSQEAAVFLNDVMKLNLSPEEVAALEDRTEGWIAGLQMAALSRGSSRTANPRRSGIPA